MSRAGPVRRVPRSAAILVLVGGMLALLLGPPASPAPREADARVLSADGDLDLHNSLNGTPVLNASGLGPGDSAVGNVTVSNLGTGSGAFSMKRQALTDIPGAGGGALSQRLQLVVSDVTNPLAPAIVYSGALGSMPDQALGTLGPGAVRLYRFEASFPEGGSADNAYAGSGASVAYKWTVSNSGGSGGSGSGGSKPGTPGTTVPGPGFVQGLKVKIASKKKQKVKKKALAVRVRCTQACSISARGKIKAKGVKKPIGKTKLARKKGKAGRWVKLKLKLSPKTLAKMKLALAARKKVTMKVTVNAKTAKGSKAKAAKISRIR